MVAIALMSGDKRAHEVCQTVKGDLCYDDKLKISSNDESVQLGNYGPPSTAGEDEFYHFSQPSEAKTTGCTNGPELLMEFDCVSSNMELMNHLTPPQTPPQTTSFGGVVGCVLPIQTPMNCLPASQQQQQQEQSQEQFHPLFVSQFNGQGMLQQEQQVSYQGTNDNTILNGYYITDDFSTVSSQIGNGGVQQQTVTLEAAPQVSGDIDATLFNFVENYTAQQVENILLGLQREPNRGTDDDESCDFSEIGSFENGGSLSPASLTSSVVGQSPAYSDSAESSAYYASSRNDGDDEDWSPSKVKKLNGRNGGAVTKKRSGPNGTTNSRGRGIEDKKSRKKEQNKNAATRYRQKKKAEIEEILVVEEQLRAENEKLRKESKDLGRDIRCIKNLLRDFLKSKI
uniref:BZIP domain-containing protein n=1 Tax=Anopheles culicifacies TaxID=139723 RepID=A0A182M6H5_9DIPT